MISIKNIVFEKLKSEDNLYVVNYFHPENINKLPIVTYYELDNKTLLYEDDIELLSEITYAVDIWNKNSTTEIAKIVDSKMRSLGFKRISSVDLYETETKIHHKAMRYVIQVTNEMQAHNDNY